MKIFSRSFNIGNIAQDRTGRFQITILLPSLKLAEREGEGGGDLNWVKVIFPVNYTPCLRFIFR